MQINKEMSLPESVQALNNQIVVTMNADVPGGSQHVVLPTDTMVTEMANNIDGTPKQKFELPNTDIHASMSATQLMQSIIKASQNSHVLTRQQSSDMKNTTHVPLPADLQSFTGDPFTMSSPTQSSAPSVFQSSSYQSSAMLGHLSSNPMFSGVSSPDFTVIGSSFGTLSSPQSAHHSVPSQTTQTQILQCFSNVVSSSQQTPTRFSEALHLTLPENNLNFESFNKNPSLPSFESPTGVNGHTDLSVDKSSVLERLLTNEPNLENKLNTIISPGSKSVSSSDNPPGSPTSSSNSQYTDSGGGFADTTHSLIMKSEKLRLDSGCSNSFALEHEDINPKLETFSWDVTHIEDDEIEHIEQAKKIRKAQKCSENSDAPNSLVAPPVERVFNAGEASATSSDFTFSKFGKKDDPGVFTFGSKVSTDDSSVGSITPVLATEQFKTPHPVSHPTRRHAPARKSKEPILNQQFPSKLGGYELKILSQPEEQHRARYLTEGSRGAVKNRTGEGYPCVKLFGFNDDATLQVFIGNDTGRVRPHGFYQACKVCGKNATMCTEKEIDGTNVIEIDLRPVNDMTASVDCVGILKLRNADVEQRIGIAKAKKKSTKARMIFRVNFTKSDGNTQTLQVASHPILCTQPIGQPEICKISLKESPANGGDELFIIGKNFLRGTKVFFQEPSDEENGGIIWEKESEIDRDYFQPTHLICTIPEYMGPQRGSGTKTVCQVLVNSGGKLSEGHPFTYIPAEPPIKQEVPMETEDFTKKTFAAPEALELNQQIQQVQQESKTERFQLPPGVISEPVAEESADMPMEQGSSVVAGQVEALSEYSEMNNEQSDRQQKSEEQNYLTTRTVNECAESVEPSSQILSDSFSFEQTSLGISKENSTFSTSTSYSDSIMSQFLENITQALQSKNSGPRSSDSGIFSTCLSMQTLSQNQNTYTTKSTVIPRSSSGSEHLFTNGQPSSMDFSLNSDKLCLEDTPSNQSIQSDSSFKDILSNSILNNLDNLQFSLEEKDSAFSPAQVVPNSCVHSPADLLSTNENLTTEARLSSEVISDSSSYQTSLNVKQTSSPIKDQISNQVYQADSETYAFLSEQQRQSEMSSHSFGVQDSVPQLKGPFQGIPGGTSSTQPISGSIPQSVTENTVIFSEGMLSTSYSSSFANPSQQDSCNPIYSAVSQMNSETLRRNSNSLTSLSSSLSLSIPNQTMSTQMNTSYMTGNGQQGNTSYSQPQQLIHGTNTSVFMSNSVQFQPGLGSVQQNLTGSPQIIICNNPPTQGLTPQAGPSIVINVPGTSSGGQNNQVENLLRSILGTLTQPQQHQSQQQQQMSLQNNQQQLQQQQQSQQQQQMSLQNNQQQLHQQQQSQQVQPQQQTQQSVHQQQEYQQQLEDQHQSQQMKLQDNSQQQFEQNLRDQHHQQDQQIQHFQLQDQQKQQQENAQQEQFLHEQHIHQNLQSPIQNLQSPYQQNLQSPIQQNLQSPIQQNLQSPIQQNLQSPIQQNLQSPIQQNLQSPIQQNLQSSQQFQLQSPQQHQVQSPQQFSDHHDLQQQLQEQHYQQQIPQDQQQFHQQQLQQQLLQQDQKSPFQSNQQ